jgi:hypothetical protein
MTDEMMTLRSMLGKESPEGSNITDPGQAPPYGPDRPLPLRALHSPNNANPLPSSGFGWKRTSGPS